jgi:hypothetical protein
MPHAPPSWTAPSRAGVSELQNQLIAALRRAAEEHHVILSHVPDRAGVSRSRFWDVLKGRKRPTLEWVEKVAVRLEVRPELLLRPTGAARTATVTAASEGAKPTRGRRR